jgi:cation:H+ antiporter
MSIANAIGSNIFNVLMILGVSAFIKTLPIKESSVGNILVLISATLLLFVLAYFGHSLVWFDGLIMLCLFAYFIRNMIKESKDNNEEHSEPLPMIKTIIFIVLGAAGIICGGNLVVNGATTIAQTFGMSDNLIGLTVVALGTSLPEFVTSVMATKKGKLDIAIGNVIGSNIFNILFVLGVSSVINPMSIGFVSFIDAIVLLVGTALFFIVTKDKGELKKWHGIVMVMSYVIYIIYTIIR